MDNIRFVRINGRVVPIKRTGMFSSEVVGESQSKKIISEERKRLPKDISKARKYAFGTGALYGLGALSLGAGAMLPKSKYKVAANMAKFGMGSVAASIIPLIGYGVHSSRASNFREADQGVKGILKNAGEGLFSLGLMAAGAATPFLLTKGFSKLRGSGKAVKKGQSIINKYDIISKFKAYRAKNVTPARKISGLLGGK